MAQLFCEAAVNVGEEDVSGKAFKFAGWMPYLVAVGCFLDVLSTFFPWSEVGGGHWFLPYSVPLPLGWQVQYVGEGVAVLFINLAVRLGGIVGVVGVAMLTYWKIRVFSNVVVLVSSGLSFASAAVFSQLGLPFFIGVYMVLAGGSLKLIGLALDYLEVEIIVENEETEGEDGDEESDVEG
ncbi:MAG: hypothetical protein ACLFU9_01335 [Candidatus Bathyarchaeia archaeon]